MDIVLDTGFYSQNPSRHANEEKSESKSLIFFKWWRYFHFYSKMTHIRNLYVNFIRFGYCFRNEARWVSRSKFIETLRLEVKNKDLFEIKFKTPLSEDLVKHLKKLK